MVEGEPCDENPSRYRCLGEFLLSWGADLLSVGFKIKHNYEISYPFEWSKLSSTACDISDLFEDLCFFRVPTVF
jgi:hypothetical protein